MKGSLFWKFAYLCCALAGIMAGYGIVSLTDVKENIGTKDNTLVRESGNGVFFDTEQEITMPPQSSIPALTPTSTPTVTPVPTQVPGEIIAPSNKNESIDILPETPEITLMPEETAFIGKTEDAVQENELPSLKNHWANRETVVPSQPEVVNVSNKVLEEQKNENQMSPEEIQETITYPAKIFGQTPIINRSDRYVSYFEFCYDLVAMVEQEVTARGLSMNVLMTKFALKALLCGVDIEQLDINAPMPRRLAALCLWLAAQVLNESGCDTSSESAERYVTDVSSCTSSERKAIAYLYEQGVVKGYQTAGQSFYPQAGLQTETGTVWLSGIKQCWQQ